MPVLVEAGAVVLLVVGLEVVVLPLVLASPLLRLWGGGYGACGTCCCVVVVGAIVWVAAITTSPC